MKNVGHDAFLVIDRDWTKSGNRGKADFVRDVVAQFSSVGCAAASENPVSFPGGNPALLFAVIHHCTDRGGDGTLHFDLMIKDNNFLDKGRCWLWDNTPPTRLSSFNNV